ACRADQPVPAQGALCVSPRVVVDAKAWRVQARDEGMGEDACTGAPPSLRGRAAWEGVWLTCGVEEKKLTAVLDAAKARVPLCARAHLATTSTWGDLVKAARALRGFAALTLEPG